MSRKRYVRLMDRIAILFLHPSSFAQMDRVILKIPSVFKKGFVRTHVISITKGPSYKLNRNLTHFYDRELAVFSRNGTNYTSIHLAPLPGPAVIDLGITPVLMLIK